MHRPIQQAIRERWICNPKNKGVSATTKGAPRRYAGAMRSENTITTIVRHGEPVMKRSILHSPKELERPLAWREAEYAAVRDTAADKFDDRVSEDIFDVEDEYTEVDTMVRGMSHDAN